MPAHPQRFHHLRRGLSTADLLKGLANRSILVDQSPLIGGKMVNNTTNATALTDEELNALEEITKDDAAWILANAFLILTMQTGKNL